MSVRRPMPLAPFGLLTIVLGCALLGWATPAGADAAGPTDYRTTIVSIDPPADGIALTVIGGDSFVQLHVDVGTEAMVVGYGGEPYLRFNNDGTVERNERSPARWYNDDRFSQVEAPPSADVEAEPEWDLVALDGTYAWHDHRAHWMNASRPPGAEPGDVVLEGVIPLRIDGEPVSVTVQSVLLDPPSVVPAVVGALVGFGLVLATRTLIGELGLVLAGAVAALGALVAGTVAYVSVPVETGPTVLLWGLPLVAMVSVVAWLWVRNSALGRTSAVTVIAPALVALAGIELLGWTWVRREALMRSLIPSDLPAELDRGILAGSIVIGFSLVGYAVRNLGGERVVA